MTMPVLLKTLRSISVVAVVAAFLGMSSVAIAAGNNKSAPAPKPAAHPSGGGSHTNTGGAGHTTTTGSHTTTTTGSHTTTTTTGSHTTTTTSSHTTTTGTHTTTTGGGAGHTNAGGAAGHTTTASHSAIHGGAAPKGSNEHVTKSGSAVRTRSNGRVSDVHDARRGMDVHNNMGGGRRVSVQRRDGSRMVSERGRRGYVERGYHYHGHDFGRRAYYYHGHEYNRYYRGYGYRGLSLSVYAPGFYFAPGFYGWAYNPWAVPIAFGWGWAGNPWYGHFGYYFAPYPVYASAAFWLTDYIISQDLEAAYAANQAAGEESGDPSGAGGGQPVLTPDVKALIADEVKNQLALENSEAQQTAQQQDVDPGSSGIARLLSDGRPHVFVAGGNLDVTDTAGQECVVSDGDTLQLRTAPPSDATTADLVVLSSKGKPECQISLTVQVQLTDLQEMQNHMRETIDQGLQDLQAKQGKDGLPPAPPSAQAKPSEPEYAQLAPPASPQDAADLQQQDQQADQAVKDVTAEAAQDGGTSGAAAAAAPQAAPAAPASVELGQSFDQVKAAMGAPTSVANLGPKVIYNYNGMKVIFKDGKVTDVQ
ncbi:MAG: hypothetical protein WAK26_13660 [Terracidiphilus sp.]